jgi:large subunit ribosomal protein L17
MFRNMVTSLLQHEKITTTDAKAKELRSIAEKMITLGKRGDLHAVRQAASYIQDKKVVSKLFTTIAPRYSERNGGYTRIVKLGTRPGDNAQLSIIELVEEQLEKKPAKKAPAKKRVKAEATPVVPALAQDAAQPVPPQIDEAHVDAAPQEEVKEATPQEQTEVVAQSTVSDPAENCEAKAD